MNRKYSILVFAILLVLSLNIISAANNTDDLANNELSKTIINKVKTDNVKTESSNTYYVDNSKNNAIQDGSKNNPYKTLNQTVLNSINDNSEIRISKGTYHVQSITFTKNLSLIGENKENTIIIANTTNTLFNISDTVKVSLKNLTIKDYKSPGNAAIENYGTLQVDDCIFDDNNATSRESQGGSIRNNGKLDIKNSLFTNNSASWGAGIYNFELCNIEKTTFSSNSIQNVGGAVYSKYGTLNVNNCNFEKNTAVSGAAIYNMLGKLNVNNTEFYKNDAAKFYGGAIYSTGVAIVNNSRFYSNHAAKDGGAITNTNNFTIDNCTFEQNSASENGGVIENVPWGTNQNGNLTLLNSRFYDNSAGGKGGVIINYKKEEYVGENSTVTSKYCEFKDNSAGGSGNLIFNEQNMIFEYNVIISNGEEVIASENYGLIDVENNWWGRNKPEWDKIGATANNWIVINATNSTAFVKNLKTKLNVNLTLNNGKELTEIIPERTAIFLSDDAVFEHNYMILSDSISNSVTSNDTISIKVDNEVVTLTPKEANITYELINNNETIRFKLNFTENITGKVTIKVNSNTIINKERLKDGFLVIDYDIPTIWKLKSYPVLVMMKTNNNLLFNENMTLNIPKRDVDLRVYVNSSSFKAGKNIQIVAEINLGNKTVDNGKVAFKINGKTIKTNVKVVNGTAILNYTLPSNFSPKNYTISVVYSGDENKNSVTNSTNITLEKQNVHINLDKEIKLLSGTHIEMTVGLLDENDLFITNGKVCYKINYKTLATNITVPDGIFTFEYDTPNVDNTTIQTFTVKYSGSSKYNPAEYDVKFIID